MVDMNLVREMVNNPDMPISVIEMAFSYLSIEDRAAIVDATTKEDLENKEWGKLILDMRQQEMPSTDPAARARTESRAASRSLSETKCAPFETDGDRFIPPVCAENMGILRNLVSPPITAQR